MSPELQSVVDAYLGRSDAEVQRALDPVNTWAVRRWCDALGDANPVYLDEDAARAAGFDGIVAPPATLHMWVTPGLHGRAVDGVTAELVDALHALGYTGAVAVSFDSRYARYLRPGDVIECVRTIEAISGEKQTALGLGVFMTSRADYRDAAGEPVGAIRLTSLRYRPHPEEASGGD